MGFSRQEYWSGLPCSPPGESAWPRDQICISCIGRQIFYQCTTCFITYLSLFPMRGRPRPGASSCTALSAISLCSLRVGFFSFLQETRWTYWTQMRPGSCKTWFQIYQPFPFTANNSYHLLRTSDVPCTLLGACLVIIIHDPYCNPGKYIYLSPHPGQSYICLDYWEAVQLSPWFHFYLLCSHLHGPEKESFATRSFLPLVTTSMTPIFLRLKSSLLAPKIPVLWLSPLPSPISPPNSALATWGLTLLRDPQLCQAHPHLLPHTCGPCDLECSP